MYYTHPKVIPWGWTNKQTDGQMDKQTDKYLLNIQGQALTPQGEFGL